MMDKTTIKESGILERYVLGELDVPAQIEVEALLESDTNLKDYVLGIEKEFENLAFDNAMKPSEHIKSNLLAKIKTNRETSTINKKSSTNWYLAIAASFAAFLLLSTYFLYSELEDVKSDLEVVSQEKTQLLNDLNSMASNYDELVDWYDVISDPNAKQYILEGNNLSSNSKVISFVNHEKKSVVINTEFLSDLDDQHDYQMWADVDGEMINMGLIPKDKNMIAMRYIEDAESLNITIEPLGGSDHPTVSRLISNVYL